MPDTLTTWPGPLHRVGRLPAVSCTVHRGCAYCGSEGEALILHVTSDGDGVWWGQVACVACHASGPMDAASTPRRAARLAGVGWDRRA